MLGNIWCVCCCVLFSKHYRLFFKTLSAFFQTLSAFFQTLSACETIVCLFPKFLSGKLSMWDTTLIQVGTDSILAYSKTSWSVLLNKKQWRARKRIHYSCEGRIENYVPRGHRLLSLGKPRDAKRRSSAHIFLSYPHTHGRFLKSSIYILQMWTNVKIVLVIQNAHVRIE